MEEAKIAAFDESSESSSSSLDTCSFCLEPINQEAYLDQCFHSFCYSCIIQWVKVLCNQRSISSIKCPLCKRENFSIIHSFNQNNFQRYYIKQDHPNRFPSVFLAKSWAFRRQCYDSTPGILNTKLNIHFYWKKCIYRRGNIWLADWLRRELQTLTEDRDIDVIVHHILGAIDSFHKRLSDRNHVGGCERKRREFKTLISDCARPFILDFSERFCDELELFLVSGLNIEAFDKLYMETVIQWRFG